MAASTTPSADDNSTTTLLKWMIAATALGALMTLFLLDAHLDPHGIRLVGPVLIFSLALVSSILLRLRRVALAVDFLALGICLFASGLAMLTGGVRSPLVLVYPVVILVYGWLRQAWAGPAMAALSMLLLFSLWLAEAPTQLPQDQTPPDSVYALNAVILCALSGVLIVFIRQAYRRQLVELDQLGSELASYAELLEQSEARHRTLIEWLPEAILVQRDTRILYANPAALQLFGAPDSATLASKCTTDLVCPEQLPAQMARMQQIREGEPHPPLAQSRFLRLDGTPLYVEVQCSAIQFDGAPAIYLLIRDITERKLLEDKIRQLAFYDALTKLPNRRLLDDRLAQTLAANQRSGSHGALMFLDLDNFKPINDLYGHAIGDQLLMQAAARLKSCVRANDTVARYGGDEFVVLLPDLAADAAASEQAALQAANKILAVMATPYPLHHLTDARGQPLADHPCSISIGLVIYAPGHTSATALIAQADAAMYQAKQAGGGRVILAPGCG